MKSPRTLAPHTHMHRRQPDGVDAYHVKHIVADVVSLAKKEAQSSGSKFHLVAHDWGGAIAWFLASSTIIIPHRHLFKMNSRTQMGCRSPRYWGRDGCGWVRTSSACCLESVANYLQPGMLTLHALHYDSGFFLSLSRRLNTKRQWCKTSTSSTCRTPTDGRRQFVTHRLPKPQTRPTSSHL